MFPRAIDHVARLQIDRGRLRRAWRRLAHVHIHWLSRPLALRVGLADQVAPLAIHEQRQQPAREFAGPRRQHEPVTRACPAHVEQPQPLASVVTASVYVSA